MSVLVTGGRGYLGPGAETGQKIASPPEDGGPAADAQVFVVEDAWPVFTAEEIDLLFPHWAAPPSGCGGRCEDCSGAVRALGQSQDAESWRSRLPPRSPSG